MSSKSNLEVLLRPRSREQEPATNLRFCAAAAAEALEGIDLGEATHKKPGTTVPESIHSFSECGCTITLTLTIPPRQSGVMTPLLQGCTLVHFSPCGGGGVSQLTAPCVSLSLFVVGDGLVQPEALNKKAIQIINRVRDKLTGRCCATNGEPEKPKLKRVVGPL